MNNDFFAIHYYQKIQTGGTLVNKNDYENTDLNILYNF